MALSAAVVLEVRNGGSDTNGGGFKTGASGTDWSQQTAAQYSVTDGVTNGTTTITSATASFGTDVVGNLISVSGGTGSVVQGWYEITARTNATTITVDRSTGLTSGTGVTLKIGGALASPGQAAAIATVAGMTTYIKYNASPYVITTASTNVAAGCISGISNTAYVGYDTTRTFYNLDANRPTLQLNAGVSTATIFGNINSDYMVQSMILDANSQTASRCIQSSGDYFYVKAMGATAGGIVQNTIQGRCTYCEITGCTAAPLQVAYAAYCVVRNNTLTSPTDQGGFMGAGNPRGFAVNCISYGNNCHGFCNLYLAVNCTAYGNSLSGFDALNNPCEFINCISEGNSNYGYRVNAGYMILNNCAAFGNSTARTGNTASGRIWSDSNPINGSSSFFTNAAGGVFTLNNTAGAGALARATGFPATFPVAAGANYSDIGAIQHQDAGGGSSGVGIIGG